jgi:hypothetical protein
LLPRRKEAEKWRMGTGKGGREERGCGGWERERAREAASWGFYSAKARVLGGGADVRAV